MIPILINGHEPKKSDAQGIATDHEVWFETELLLNPDY